MTLKQTLLLAMLAFMAFPVVAAGVPEGNASASSAKEKQIIGSDAFLDHHPDIKYRLLGLQAYEQGRFKLAWSHFRHSARYADKPSQSMLAEMLWKGEGVAMDRALAYAWMDIAAERGYPAMVGFRERYWAQLDAAQRQEAVARGQSVLGEFGDAVAKPRLEKLLERQRRRLTGSRVGFVGALQVHIPGPGGMTVVSGDDYYADHFWKPEQYWRWQDLEWRKPGQGKVEVGPLEQAPDKSDSGQGQ